MLDVLRVSNAISVPWRGGDTTLGVVAAYDSLNPEGFSRGHVGAPEHRPRSRPRVAAQTRRADLTRRSSGCRRWTPRGRLLLNLSTAVDPAANDSQPSSTTMHSRSSPRRSSTSRGWRNSGGRRRREGWHRGRQDAAAASGGGAAQAALRGAAAGA